jgi:Cu/Ag efflux protein CusF
MNTTLLTRTTLLLATAASLLALPAQHAAAQPANAPSVTSDIEVLRGQIKADRKVVIAEAMQLTGAESVAFWPLYRSYRAEMDKIGDGLVKLVLEYADAYPNVPEDRAKQLLKDYTALEKKLPDQRASYLKKFARILPASKVLRLAQLENRLDLALRLQLASAIPLAPIEGKLTGSAAMSSAMAPGVPGGVAVQTFELTATVAAIDRATRKVTLVSPDGIKQNVRVGREAINSGQIRLGDRLKVTVTEQLLVYVAGEGETPSDAGAQLVALAPKGAKPGGVMAETTQVTAKVTAIDVEHRKATLQFEDGTTRTVAVRPDVDLAKHKVGDKVVIRVTEALALTVEKP